MKKLPSDICVQRRLKSICASAQSDQSLRCLHGKPLHPLLTKKRPLKILIGLRECAGLNLHCAHMSEGRLSDVAARIL